jgi:hypothetical protein
MKMKFLLAFLILGTTALNTSQAQIHLNINIGNQPIWGPVGYDHVENYYLPDIETYYNVPQQRYTYLQNGRWITSVSLPPRFSTYNLYSGYKVVVNEPRPYLHDNDYRNKYASYRGRHDQQVIRDSREEKYFENRNHPQHNQWKSNGHDNRNRNGKGDDDEKGNGKEKGGKKGKG